MKVVKHERTPSITSQDLFPDQPPVQDDPHTELAAMRNMLSSTYCVTIFCLSGDEQDDPDLYPIQPPVRRSVFVKTESREDKSDIYAAKPTSADTIHYPTNRKLSSGLSHILLVQARPNTVR